MKKSGMNENITKLIIVFFFFFNIKVMKYIYIYIWYSNQIIQDSKVVQVFFFSWQVKEDIIPWYSILHLTVKLHTSWIQHNAVFFLPKKIIAKDIFSLNFIGNEQIFFLLKIKQTVLFWSIVARYIKLVTV